MCVSKLDVESYILIHLLGIHFAHYHEHCNIATKHSTWFNILLFILAYCGPCCQLGRDVLIYTDNEIYTPTSQIELFDVNDNELPDLSSIRPSSNSSVVLVIPDRQESPPYIKIGLQMPGSEEANVDIADIKLPGNIATVTINITEDYISQTWISRTLNVDKDGYVKLPPQWRVGVNNMIPARMIQITPESVRPDSNHPNDTYSFKVYIYGCPLGKQLYSSFPYLL